MRAFIALILLSILFVLCWPLAVILFVGFVFVWLILIPFKIAFFSIGVIFKVVGAIFMFPFKVIGLA